MNASRLPAFLPLYQQTKVLITQRLSSGEWAPGSAIPSEMELAAEFGVSQGTVRKAIDELAAENILVRRQGKGTFVATHTDDGEKYRFLRLVSIDGEREYPLSRLLSFRRGAADAEVAAGLDVRPGSAIWIIDRLLSLREEPTVLDRIHLAVVNFPDLSAERIEQHWNKHRGTLYGLFETIYSQRIIRGDERLTARNLTEAEAQMLGLAPGAAALEILRVAYTYDNRVVEYRRSLCNTSTHHYFSQLS